MADWSDFDPMAAGHPFSLANKLERALWQLCWLFLARWTPPQLFGWRNLLLRLFGARVGEGVRLYSSVKVWLPRNLAIGDSAIVGPGAILYNQGKITVGRRAVISQRAHVCASTHDVSDAAFTLVTRPIVIGEACWVAAEAFVGPGVTMGEGAVLAARGALFESIEPMTIYRGNPAILLKKREFRKA